ncbi:MAG: T9SS type A sorting domain-containing protein [Bacteroidetes bacterium]|nr:T9SS type A sorting domain-containing protein [Bacteroidota bacterium]
MRIFLILCIININTNVLAQTFTGSGNPADWNTPTNWSPNGVPSGSTTNVNVNSSKSPILNTGASNTIGNVTLTSSETLTISTGASLTLGSSAQFNAGTPDKRSMNFTSSGTLNVNTGASGDGTLEIWGDLIVTSSLTMNISGNLIIHGDFQMTSSGTVTVTGGGTITIDGNLTGTSSDKLSVSGTGSTLTVGGSISLGSSGQITTSGGGTINAGSCTCSGCQSQCNAVPILLSSFSSSSKQNSIELNWSTSSEINFNYFSLQRSANGKDFNEITQVQGHGTTNEAHHYQYEDRLPFIGKNYYRLTSVDFDNYQETFKVIAQEFYGNREFSISPNPTDGRSIRLNFNFESADGLLTLYNNIGYVVATYEITGAGDIDFESPLKSGIYLAKFSSGDFNKTVRFVVN